MKKHLCAAAAGTVLLAFSTVSASAAYACNGNVCWVIKERYTYPTESRVVIREEAWKPGPEITVREHGPGRGYYVGAEWRAW